MSENKPWENIIRIPTHLIKVPRELIYSSELPEHRISSYIYLNYHQTWERSVGYSPIHMIEWSGYKPRWDKSKKRINIYQKFKIVMDWLAKRNYIKNYDDKKFIQSTFQSSILNGEKFNPIENYGIIYDFEIETIMNYQSSYKPLNKSILLLVLSYIRLRTLVRNTTLKEETDDIVEQMPEYCYAFYEDMERDIGVGCRMISRAVGVLEELGLVIIKKSDNFQAKDKNSNTYWNNGQTIFVCPYKIVYQDGEFHIFNYDWQRELRYAEIDLRNKRNKKGEEK